MSAAPPSPQASGIAWPEAAVRAALGLPAAAGRVPLVFSGIATDTRVIAPDALFVALRGERFDAHEFLDAARAAGAAGAVVHHGTPPVPGLPFFEVPDTLRALGEAPFVSRAGNGIVFHCTNLPAPKSNVPAHLLRRVKDAFDPKHQLPELPA